MNLKDEFEPIRNWAGERGIYKSGDIKTQFIKAMEEMGELSTAVLKQKKWETADAIGDIIVVLTSVAYFNGVSIEECINSAYQEIRNRKGQMISNNFVKNDK